MENILISACLLGVNCKYSGGNNYKEEVLKLKDSYNLIPVCPEILGGLATPREPAEIVGNKVMSKDGQDVTEEFKKGAEEALRLAKFFNVKKVILKASSPSCGFGSIYDGSFTGKKIDGNGITADLLIEHDIKVLNM